MRIFQAKEDINFFGLTIIKNRQLIEFLDNETSFTIKEGTLTLELTLQQIIEDKRFEELIEEENLNIDIIEIEDDEDLKVKNFRIQLDIKTTRKQAREIESILRKTISNFL